MYSGLEDGIFFGLYLNAKRGYLPATEKIKIAEVIKNAEDGSADKSMSLPAGLEITHLNEKDVPELAKIYKNIFQFYPFPIHEEDYLRETMNSEVHYFGIRSSGKLVAVSSADIDIKNSCAEMTDFATLKEFRGQNLSYFLLGRMLEDMTKMNLNVVYTIARATSPGMNKTFARHAFEFTGTLQNNTRIGDDIESMNVWYKSLI
jgi:putative beta-lysine N-acetyltransferase